MVEKFVKGITRTHKWKHKQYEKGVTGSQHLEGAKILLKKNPSEKMENLKVLHVILKISELCI